MRREGASERAREKEAAASVAATGRVFTPREGVERGSCEREKKKKRGKLDERTTRPLTCGIRLVCRQLFISLSPSPQEQGRRTFQLLDARKPYCFRAIVGGEFVSSAAERGENCDARIRR